MQIAICIGLDLQCELASSPTLPYVQLEILVISQQRYKLLCKNSRPSPKSERDGHKWIVLLQFTGKTPIKLY